MKLRDGQRRSVLFLIGIFFLPILLGACRSSEEFYRPQAIGSKPFGADRSLLQMEVVPRAADTLTGADIHLAVGYRNLAFVNSTEGYRADYTITAQMRDPEGGGIVRTESWQDSLLLDSYEQTQQRKDLSIERHLSIQPGTYQIRVTFEDRTSGRRIGGQQQLQIPDVQGIHPFLGPIHLQSKVDTGGYQPIVATHIPRPEDTVRASADLYNTERASSVHVRYTLLRYRTDFTRAKPPHALTPMFGSMEYQGIEYDEVDTVKVVSYDLSPPPEESTLNFTVDPELENGIYEVSVHTEIQLRNSEKTIEGEQYRRLSIKKSDFPQVGSLDRAAEALSYIMDDDEVEEIRNGDSWEDKKHRFDAFWGENIGNRNHAREVLRLYFDRVEEANRLFTNHKEGWKTDRGMIYVVFGAPRYVEHYVNSEVWFYGTTTNDQSKIFLFKKVRRANDQRGSYYNYVLQRQPYYSRRWNRHVSNWRNGEVY